MDCILEVTTFRPYFVAVRHMGFLKDAATLSPIRGAAMLRLLWRSAHTSAMIRALLAEDP